MSASPDKVRPPRPAQAPERLMGNQDMAILRAIEENYEANARLQNGGGLSDEVRAVLDSFETASALEKTHAEADANEAVALKIALKESEDLEKARQEEQRRAFERFAKAKALNANPAVASAAAAAGNGSSRNTAQSGSDSNPYADAKHLAEQGGKKVIVFSDLVSTDGSINAVVESGAAAAAAKGSAVSAAASGAAPVVVAANAGGAAAGGNQALKFSLAQLRADQLKARETAATRKAKADEVAAERKAKADAAANNKMTIEKGPVASAAALATKMK